MAITWQYIQRTTEDKQKKNTQVKYKNLDKKLNKPIREQTTTPIKTPHILSQGCKQH